MISTASGRRAGSARPEAPGERNTLGSTSVLHVINGLGIGGAERLLVDLTPALRAIGIRADVVVLDGTAPGTFAATLKEACPGSLTVLAGLGRYDPRHVPFLVDALRRYDIVHAHLFPAQHWAAAAKMVTGSGRLVVTEHSAWNRRLSRAWSRRVDRAVYQQYDAVCCVSGDVVEVLRRHALVDPGRIHLISNGIDLEAFRGARPVSRGEISSRLTDSDRLIAHVAGFRPQKDQVTVLRALQGLPADVKVLFVGDGVTRVACERIAHELGVAGRAIFLGGRDDVPGLLAASEVAVLSSHFEGLPLSAIEGMASGRPFVASRVPGLRELVDGAGVLFAEGDAGALAQCLARLLDDPGEREAIAAQCATRAAMFDVRETARRYADLYLSLA